MSPAAVRRFRPGAGALERAACLCKEDIIERRFVQLESLDSEAGSIQRSNDRGQVAAASIEPDRHRTRGAGHRVTELGEQVANCLPLVSDTRHNLDGRATYQRLERLRSPLGHDASAIDDADAIGENVGFLEILRRQEHGHAFVAREAGYLLPQRSSALRVKPLHSKL